MTDRERAFEYLKIFIGAGDRWRFYVPLDADLVADTSVRIGTCEVGPGPDGEWWLRDLSTGLVRRYKRAVTS